VSGEALLSIYDPSSRRVIDLPVTWKKGFDTDARIQIPKRLGKDWKDAIKLLRRQMKRTGEGIAPFPTLPIEVDSVSLTKSASGFFIIAREIWRGVGWREAPPYPKVQTAPEGAVQ